MTEKTVAIIQARMASTRLPGKVLMNICGKPVLEHVIERTKKCKRIDSIVVATTNKPEDIKIAKLAKKCKVKIFTGKENDVLDRFYQSAKRFNADVIVRITADCPLINPSTIDEMINLSLKEKADYISADPTLPSIEQGADVISLSALKRIKKLATKNYQKEHIIIFVYENPELFRIKTIKPKSIFQKPDIRLTVDTKDDLKLMREIYKRLYKRGKVIDLKDVVKLLDANPQLKKINAGVEISEINKYSTALRKKSANLLRLNNTNA